MIIFMKKNIILVILVIIIIILGVFIITDSLNKKGNPINNLKILKSVDGEETPIEKAIASLNKAISDNPLKTISEESYEDFYSYHYFGYFDSRALIIARFDDPNKSRGKRWDLILLEGDGKQTKLYSDLIQDCCGGGMPQIKTADNAPFIAEIISATGDVCFFSSEKLYIDIRDNPKEYIRVENSNMCENFSKLSIGGNNISGFTFEPIVSVACDDKNIGAKTSFLGLTAKSDKQTYTKYFSEPIDMNCSREKEYKEGYYSMGVDYTETNIINKSILNFNVSLYSPEEDKTITIPISFSLLKGF